MGRGLGAYLKNESREGTLFMHVVPQYPGHPREQLGVRKWSSHRWKNEAKSLSHSGCILCSLKPTSAMDLIGKPLLYLQMGKHPSH